jgi:hypothetical protein
MNEKNSIPLLLDSDFPTLVGWLITALVPIISWTVIA